VLTFGAGPHVCLGQNIGRAELEKALVFLAPRLPGLRPAGTEQLGESSESTVSTHCRSPGQRAEPQRAAAG
jgi:cytochrome P450